MDWWIAWLTTVKFLPSADNIETSFQWCSFQGLESNNTSWCWEIKNIKKDKQSHKTALLIPVSLCKHSIFNLKQIAMRGRAPPTQPPCRNKAAWWQDRKGSQQPQYPPSLLDLKEPWRSLKKENEQANLRLLVNTRTNSFTSMRPFEKTVYNNVTSGN